MPASLKSPESEFLALADRSTEQFARPFAAMLKAIVDGDIGRIRSARDRLAAVIGQTMALADVLGRRRVVLEARYYSTGDDSQFAATPVVPNVPFKDAIGDILSRTPELAPGLPDLVSEIYNQRHGFALARSSEQVLTEAVQGFIGKALREGKPAPSVLTQVQELGDFSRGYANSVYRTNLTTAYTAGRFQQAQEPGVRTVLPAMERWEVMDSGTRRGRKEDGPRDGVKENHAAVHGLVMKTTDPRWGLYAPPSGYGCRGGVRMVPVPELRRRGLINESGDVTPYFPPGIERFAPHPRFGKRRPDLLIYGGGA